VRYLDYCQCQHLSNQVIKVKITNPKKLTLRAVALRGSELGRYEGPLDSRTKTRTSTRFDCSFLAKILGKFITRTFNPLTAEWALRALIDFTLSNARRFYSSMGNPLDGKGLTMSQLILLFVGSIGCSVVLILLAHRKMPNLLSCSWALRSAPASTMFHCQIVAKLAAFH